MACLKDPNHLPRSLQKFFGQSQMGDLELYQMDSWTKTGPKQARGSLSGWMRYLFEGRGIVISNWTMNLNVELYKGHPDFQVDLLKLDKELKQIQGEEDLSPKTCEVLRQKSLSALAQLAKSVTSKSLPPASQTEKAAK